MPTAFSLLAGREVDTASEEWRLECECAWLLDQKPTRTLKHLFLYGVEIRERLFVYNAAGKQVIAEIYETRHSRDVPMSIYKMRGLEAADKLLADAKRLHEARIARATEISQPAA